MLGVGRFGHVGGPGEGGSRDRVDVRMAVEGLGDQAA